MKSKHGPLSLPQDDVGKDTGSHPASSVTGREPGSYSEINARSELFGVDGAALVH
jgi:hypothetical protein